MRGRRGLIRLARSRALRDIVCVRTDAFVRGAAALSRPALPAEVRAGLRAPYKTAGRRSAIGDFVADIPLEPDHPSRPAMDGIVAGLDRLGGVPTLLLWGPRDRVFGESYLHDLRTRLPHAAVHRYPGASHLLVEDRPRAAADTWCWVDSLPAVAADAPAPASEQSASEQPGPVQPAPQDPAPQPAPQHPGPATTPADAPPLLARLLERAGDPEVAVAELSGDHAGHLRGRGTKGGSATSISASSSDSGQETQQAHVEPRLTSFGELNERVTALAGGLCRAGVRPGQRVGLLIRPGLDLTTVVYACWRVGASIVVADAGLGLRRLGDALRSADPAWLIGIPAGLAAATALDIPGRRIVVGRTPLFGLARLGRIEHTLAELMVARSVGHPELPDPALSTQNLATQNRLETEFPDPESVAIGSLLTESPDDAEAAVLFTSGATGPPKGVVYRHRQLRAQLDLVRTVCRVSDNDRLVAAFAPFALYGPALGIAAAVPDMDVTKPASLTAGALADAAAAVDATLVFASPSALRNVAATAGALTTDQRRALDGIRLVLSAGAPVSPALLRKVQAALPRAELHTPYGMTEALPITDISLAEIDAAGTGNGVCVGRPLPGVRVRISALDSTGAATGELTVALDVTGEVCVSAAHVKDRYDQLWATEHASSRDPGWHRTGDVGHLDDRGRLWIEGRLVHVITTADGPVTPVAIEHRIELLDEVESAAIIGVGPAGTQQIVAVVVRPGQYGVAAVRGHRAHRSRGSLRSRESRRSRRSLSPRPLAEPGLAAEIRAAAGVPVAAVLVVPELPTDIRHQAKIDRARLATWAEKVLSGRRPGRP